MGRDVDAKKDLSSLLEVFKIIRSERPDILHLHSPKAAGIGALTGRILGVPRIIYTIHGWAFNEDRPLWQKIVIGAASWGTMLLTHFVITLSEKETLQTLNFPAVKDKVRHISLGITPPKFKLIKDARSFIETKIGRTFDKGTTIIGTISELHPNKGLVWAIEAMAGIVKRHHHVVFVIIGEGEQRPRLQKLIDDNKLNEHVYLAGYVENAAQYLKAFSLFTLTSVKEGLPYAILEAGHAGVPVIATAVGGIPEMVDDMRSGILIQPKKTSEIKHALEFILEHKALQKEYGKIHKETIKERFDSAKMFDATFALYEEPLPEPAHETDTQEGFTNSGDEPLDFSSYSSDKATAATISPEPAVPVEAIIAKLESESTPELESEPQPEAPLENPKVQ